MYKRQGINNITKAVEKGIASDALLDRLTELEKEKKDLTSQLREEEKYIYRIDRDQVVFWLTKFQGGDIEDEDCRRRIIDLLVNSVTVWDEPDGYKITTAYNLTSCKTKTFRVSNNADSPSGEGFGFGELSSTKKRTCFSAGPFSMKFISAQRTKYLRPEIFAPQM